MPRLPPARAFLLENQTRQQQGSHVGSGKPVRARDKLSPELCCDTSARQLRTQCVLGGMKVLGNAAGCCSDRMGQWGDRVRAPAGEDTAGSQASITV